MIEVTYHGDNTTILVNRSHIIRILPHIDKTSILVLTDGEKLKVTQTLEYLTDILKG